MREEKRAQSGGGGADDGRIIHSDAQKNGGECVLHMRVCVCVRVLREPPLIALAADRRHGGNILECHALEKSAADPNEASWEYGV